MSTVLLEEVVEMAWLPADLQAEPRELGAPLSWPCPWNVHSIHRSHFKDTALTEQGIVETILTAYVIGPN